MANLVELKVPTLPESVADGVIAAWHKKVGEFVNKDENLVDLETDKVVIEIPAPASGILKEIKKKAGDTVIAHELIGSIEPGAAPAQTAAPVVAAKEPAKESAKEPVKQAVSASPAVRRVLNENEIAASEVEGTGKKGRITKEDALRHVNAGGSRQEQRVPLSRIRQRIADRLVEVKQSTAMLTTFNEVNMKPVMDIRLHYKDAFEKAHGVKLGFMSFFTRATVEALKRFPDVNASLDGSDVVYHGYCDVGIAVSSERGLVVPVLRNAELMSMADIEIAIRDYALKARANKLTIEDMQGGTFTITNGGIFGSMLSTPILNSPQSAILGMHNIVERPVAENGAVVIRPIMYLALSYDHRIIDGKSSVGFLKTIKDLLEDPARLLLNI